MIRSLILWIVLSSAAVAALDEVMMPPPKDLGGYLTFYLDNDLFAGEDSDYTNGARLSWVSSDRMLSQVGPIQRKLQPISGDPESWGIFQSVTGFRDPDKIRYSFGTSLTQLMFTPETFALPTQPVGERRYAGWLALGFSLHVKDEWILNTVELSLGVTGKHAFAENTQDFIHDLRGTDKFNGWENQIPSEFTVDLSFVQKRRREMLEWTDGNFRMDGLTEWGARLGTFRSEASIGGSFRVGYNLPADFSDARLTATAYSHQYFTREQERESNWSVYLTGGANAAIVAHDATLDGPLFSDFETGNDRRLMVGLVYAGAAVRYRNVEFSYVHSWQSKEYDEQSGSTAFGSVAVRVRF